MVASDAQSPAAFPQAEISNGLVTVKLLLPDAQKGYYRGARFDWSGVIASLRTAKHEYFGQWFERYDPKNHDCIMGPVEEFLTGENALSYAEAKPGENFVRIGVGTLRRGALDQKFNRFGYYELIDPGEWKVRKEADSIEFTHTLKGPNGYAYRYTKTIRLKPGATVMTIEHTLENTGAKRIATSQYNHNFFMFDAKPTGPGASVHFPFELKATAPFEGDAATVHGGDIRYARELATGQTFMGLFSGSSKASDYDIRVEHAAAGAGVRITGSLPISRIVYWSIRTTLCPEAYVDLDIEPGATAHWTYTYEFLDLPSGKE